MARDRKRAKQRQQRRPSRAAAPAHSDLQRADLPGALEHASGDVEEFDAALVRGAGGVAAPLEDAPEAPEANGAGAGSDAEALAASSGGSGGGDRSGRGNGLAVQPAGEGDVEAPLPAAAPRESRRARRRAAPSASCVQAGLSCNAYSGRTASKVSQATAVVLGFVAIAGAYLGAADWLAQKIVNFIL